MKGEARGIANAFYTTMDAIFLQVFGADANPHAIYIHPEEETEEKKNETRLHRPGGSVMLAE